MIRANIEQCQIQFRGFSRVVFPTSTAVKIKDRLIMICLSYLSRNIVLHTP